MDTVFDPGTAAERPFRIDDGIAHGPGVTDMKSGLLAGLYALKAIIGELGGLPFERLTFIANPDEEIGSPTSVDHIRAAAADVDACLVLECARANGDIVSARKGILDTRLTVHGRAAHAGVEPEKGRNAILEAARIVRDLHALNGRWPGVTVNVGKIAGGTRPNVVAERCDLEVDVRATTADGLAAVEAAVRELVATTEVAGHHRRGARHGRLAADGEAGPQRPPRRACPGGRASGSGFEVHDTATGGASDANTTSGMGVPTLDGLGPIGGNDHSPAEYLEVDSIVPRTAMLAGLLLAIARDPEVLGWRADDPRFAARGVSGERRGSRRAARGSGSPGTAARSSSAMRAGSPARPTPAPMARRSTRATSPARRGPSSRSSSGRSPRAGSRWRTSSGRGCSSPTWPTRRALSAVHGEVFGEIRPAATMVAVAGLMHPSLLVEIEAEARRG